MIANFIYAQQVKVNWGDESKTELGFGSFVNGQGSDMIKLCFDYSGGGLFSKKVETPVLTRYNDKLAEQNVKSFTADEKGVSYDNLMSIKGKLFLFTERYDKDSKSTDFMCQQVNITTLETVGAIIDLGSFDAVGKSSQSTVEYELSKDSSKVLMFGVSPQSKKDNQKYYIGVYDNNMKKIWENTVELPYKDKFVDILDQLVTNDGKVGVIIKHYDQEVSREAISKDGTKVPSYKTKFLLYEPKQPNPAEYIINTSDKFVHTLQLTDDNTSNLTLFGLYKDRYNGYISGYFTASIDKVTKAVSTGNMNAFPQALVEQVKIDKQGSDKEKDPGFAHVFRLVDIVDRENGSKDYLLEYSSEVFVPGYTTYGANGMTFYHPSYWVYDYGDIIDICINPNAATVITRIPKMQSSTNTRSFSNFRALPYKDKLVLLYNDDDDNIDRDLAKKPETLKKFDKCVFIMAVVDSKGTLTRSVVFSHKDVSYTAAVRVSQIIDKNRLGIYSQKGGGLFSKAKDMIGILEIK
jgi:hypothetical protein